MKIISFQQENIPEAAALFGEGYVRQRQAVPALPEPAGARVEPALRLDELVAVSEGLVAVDGQRMVGFLGWYLLPQFRDMPRLGAYVPEWAHAARGDKMAVYRALYRVAAERWAAAGCGAHAITILAADRDAVTAWFWQGFGMLVVDALRPARPLDEPPQTPLRIRRATAADAAALAALDREHCRHYEQPPIFMTPRECPDAAGNAAFLAQRHNNAWLACDNELPVGFIRCETGDFGTADIVKSPETAAVTGAYVRPAYRGQKGATALLNAALAHYGSRGFSRLALDFEAFNQEAAGFWPRYFDPVCYSLLRIPEAGVV